MGSYGSPRFPSVFRLVFGLDAGRLVLSVRRRREAWLRRYRAWRATRWKPVVSDVRRAIWLLRDGVLQAVM